MKLPTLFLSSMALVLFGHYHPVHTFQLSATTSSWARTSTSYASRSRMYAAAEAAADDTASRGNNDVLLLSTQKTLWRNSWTSWWCQFPLSIVSTVILIFARSILLNSTSSTDAIRKEAAGLFLTGTGMCLCLCPVLQNISALNGILSILHCCIHTYTHMFTHN